MASINGVIAMTANGWTQKGKIRVREREGGFDLEIDGLTTQPRYYKTLLYEFFRKEWRGARAGWGDFSVEIVVEYQGDPPMMDLDNLAKAVLDGIKKHVFHDDVQVARLVVERKAGERERLSITARPR